MPELPHRPRQRNQQTWWRRFAMSAAVGAAAAFCLALVRVLMIERGSDVKSRPVVAGRATQQPEHPQTAFEPTDWNLAPVAWVYIGTLVLLVISCLVLIVAYPEALPDASRALHINPPGPRLQTNPQSDLQRFRAAEDKQLNGYYWIDKQKGLVHIPIEQAMKKLAQQGIDGFPKAQP